MTKYDRIICIHFYQDDDEKLPPIPKNPGLNGVNARIEPGRIRSNNNNYNNNINNNSKNLAVSGNNNSRPTPTPPTMAYNRNNRF